jgi:hypothetical protein
LAVRESDELASAFVELEALVRQSSRLPGLAAAQDEARRRRGHRVAWVAAAMVVLVLAGVATVSSGWLRRAGLPVLDPTPSVTTDPTPSPSGTTPPTPAGAVLADMTPPARVRNAALEVPAFDLAACPSGRLQFVDRSFGSSEGTVLLEYAAVGDVDADGSEDILVSLRCGPATGEHGVFPVQVVAYSGPALTLLGPVPTGNLSLLSSLLVGPGGEVQLGMARTGDAPGIAFSRHRWTGSGFELVEDVDVPADALPDVVVNAEPGIIQLDPGGPAKTLVVTVRNDGPTSAIPLQLYVVWTAPIAVEVEGFAGSAAESRYDLLIAAPRAGETIAVTLRIALPTGATLGADPLITGAVDGNPGTDVDLRSFTATLQGA